MIRDPTSRQSYLACHPTVHRQLLASIESEVRPIRIRRLRARGYDMQEESRTANGLPCIFVGRPTNFGNPFKLETFGREVSLELYRNNIHGIWHQAPLNGRSKELRDMALAAHMEFIDRFDVLPIITVRDELRGYNLSCYCCLVHECHADDLLAIANRDE